MGSSSIRGDHEPRARNAGRKTLQIQRAGKDAPVRQPGLPADLLCPGTLLRTARKNHSMAVPRQRPGHLRKPFCGPQPAGERGAHMDDGGAGDRRGRSWWAQRTVQWVGVDAVPLQQARPARAFVHVLNPLGPIGVGAAVRKDGPGAGGPQERSALRALAVQVDGKIDAAPDAGEREEEWLLQPCQRKQLVTAHQLQRTCQPVRRRIEQAMARKCPPKGVEGGHCNQEIPEAQGAEHQQDRPNIRLTANHHRSAFRAAAPGPDPVSQESIPEKLFARCLGTTARGNYVRMGSSETPRLRAVLFDRDGTLVVDVPYNGDPGLVRTMPGAKAVLDELRARGLATGVLSNQSGVARGILTDADVANVNARIEELLGPFDVWEVCPHAAADGCACRKPAPGMVHSACRRLGIHAAEAALIGDIGSDVQAAEAAGAIGILVPTPVTRADEVNAARLVARDLAGAVDLLLERA